MQKTQPNNRKRTQRESKKLKLGDKFQLQHKERKKTGKLVLSVEMSVLRKTLVRKQNNN